MRTMSDLELEKTLRRGDKDGQVRLVQEWLCLHGQNVAVDGDFGAATEAAVNALQSQKRLPINGIVDAGTFTQLVAPMRAALAPIAAQRRSLGDLVVAYAQQHLQQHPREIGGQNKGPWVRLYMGGHEGTEWAWCAGFACYCLTQAANAVGVPMPITPSYSCDALAASGKSQGKFIGQPSSGGRASITPGSLFLVRKTSADWTHT